MNERKLRIFFEVATTLNMTQVAEKLFISQPAISQTIQEIETMLETKLFDRINKRLYLTPQGKIFLNYTRRILNLYDEAIQTVKEMHNLSGGQLRIGASTTIGIYILPEIIGKFLKEYKKIDISIVVENTRHITEMLLDNSIDFAFVEGPVSSPEIIVENFCDDELVFITAYDHPWNKSDYIHSLELSQEKIIMREEGSGTREVFETALRSNNINYEIAFELGNTEAIKKAVEAGLGISCISQRCIMNEVATKRLSMFRLSEAKIMRQLYLIYHKDKFLSNLFNTFISFAKFEANL
ncbi:MAG: LysR family transcriptional regulator [Bacillota bacterium]